MTRLRFVIIGALLLALAGCNPSGSTGGSQTTNVPATAAPTTATTEETAETTLPTEPATSAPPGTPAPQSGEVQREQITIDAAGLLQPTAITTTVGVTLALALDNQSENDALLLFDLSPTGTFAVNVSSTGLITGTPTPIAETSIPTSTSAPTATSQLLLVPTSSASSILTDTATVTDTAVPDDTAEPTATITGTTMPTPQPGTGQVVYLRYDQPGSYEVTCVQAARDTGGLAGCSGSVTITVEEAAPMTTATPEGTSTTPEVTVTIDTTGTPAITTTAEITATSDITSEPATADTTAETTAEATAEGTAEATAAPAETATSPTATP
jgi:hypothetical protein